MPKTRVKKRLPIKRRKVKEQEEYSAQIAHKFFNLQRVITETKIDQDKVYNNFKGEYKSLSPEEGKQIATCLMRPVQDIFARLGMRVKFEPMPGRDLINSVDNLLVSNGH
jgi:hypothetical protein